MPTDRQDISIFRRTKTIRRILHFHSVRGCDI